MEKPLFQPNVGFFDKIFRTYKWQIKTFERIGGEKRFEFLDKYKLYEKIELEGMDLGRWYADPRINILLFTLAHFPECDCEHTLSVIKAKAPEIIDNLATDQVIYGLDGPNRYAMIMLEKKKDDAAAVLFDILSASREIIANRYGELLRNTNSPKHSFDYRDIRDNREATEDKWLETEFWRASAYHNIYMKDKSDFGAKENAAEAINRFLMLEKTLFTKRYSPIMYYKYEYEDQSENAKAISKLLKEEY